MSRDRRTAWLASGRNVKASHESGEKRGRSVKVLLRNILVALFIVLVAGPVLTVVVYRFVPPPATPLMVIRLAEGKGWNHHWRDRRRLAGPAARPDRRRGRPVLRPPRLRLRRPAEGLREQREGQEDPRRLDHQPADRQERLPVAGPLLCPQGAGGLFHGADRDDLGQEADHGGLSELHRIRPGHLRRRGRVAGLFQGRGRQLTPQQAARLAAILPSPLKWKAVNPGRYVKKRSSRIGKASGAVRRDGLAACVV
jgi:monofunctional biosynthetic peptidoglycan transglycosylase